MADARISKWVEYHFNCEECGTRTLDNGLFFKTRREAQAAAKSHDDAYHAKAGERGEVVRP